MFQRLTEIALREKFATIVLVGILFFSGVWAFHRTPIESYPELAPLTVQVISQWPGRAADEVERYITVPIETVLNGIPGETHIRSVTLLGLSVISVNFEDNTDIIRSRQLVMERLASATIPAGVQPGLNPNASVTGEIYRYTLQGNENVNLMELKTVQDWYMTKELRTIPGVEDVRSFGGYSKEYQVQVDPLKLKNYQVTLQQVFNALSNGNGNVGAQVISHGEQNYSVRGLGLLHTTDDIGKIVVASQKGTPIFIHDVASVVEGPKPRLGVVGKRNQDEVVEGVVILRLGEDSAAVLKRVRAKIDEIQKHGLPPGVKLIPYYDRGQLTDWTISTVRENLIMGMIMVIGILLIFLWSFSGGLIPALTIPAALLGTFVFVYFKHIPANFISLGAIDFGVIANASIIILENIFRHFHENHEGKKANKDAIVLDAVVEVQRPMIFSTAILTLAYIPLFLLQGVEGRLFMPMAYMMGGALLLSVLLALTLVPVLASLWLKPEIGRIESPLMVGIRKVYHLLFGIVFRFKKTVVLGIVGLIVLTVLLIPSIGREFLPVLEENNIWLRVTLPATINLEYAQELSNKIRRELQAVPEVNFIVSELGRPDDGTDIGGFFMIQNGIYLKEPSLWPKGVTKEDIIEQIARILDRTPGINYIFAQYLEDMVEEGITGIEGSNGIKIFGSDPKILEQKGIEIVKILRDVPGIKEPGLFWLLGQPQLNISVDREACARYGINVADVENTIQMAVGGQTATTIYQGNIQFDGVVRLLPRFREDITAIEDILVPSPDGTKQIPIKELAQIQVDNGLSFLYREDHSRYAAVRFAVRGVDLATAVSEARRRIEAKVHFPQGYHYELSGEFDQMESAQEHMSLILPITFVLIVLLLYWAFKSLRQALLITLVIPFALVGSLLGLKITDTSLSVPAVLGFLSLMGIAVQDGVLLISLINQLREKGMGLVEAVKQGTELRLRPVIMTAMVASMGLLPASLATGIGSQAQKPMAIIIVWGTLSAMSLTLIVLPLFYSMIHRDISPKKMEIYTDDRLEATPEENIVEPEFGVFKNDAT